MPRMQETETSRFKLSAIKDRLNQADIRWAIFAGAAAFCYGSKRQVTDVDVLVRCEDLQKAKAALRDVDIEGFDVVCGFEIKTDQGTYPFFLDDEMIERIKWRKLFGVSVPVISVEDNIVLKAILQRGESQGKYDIEDIWSMIKSEKIDLEYLKRRIRKCQAGNRVKFLLQSLHLARARHGGFREDGTATDQV